MSRNAFPVSSKAIHAVVGIAIMLLFPHLPIALPHVTQVGMEILGIFVGTLYLWTTVDPIWASLLSIFMVGVSSYAPMPQVLQSAFDAPVVVQMFFLMLGFPVPPYSGNSLALLNNFSTITENMGNKVVVNNAAYMFLAILHALTAMVVIILFCKYVLRPDVSKLKDLDVEKLKKNPLPPLNNNQKFMAITFVIYILSMLLPSILPKTGFIGFLSKNSTGIALGYAALLACVNLNKDSSTPVLPFGKVMANFAWATFFLCTSAILLGNVLTNESTGISAFLNAILGPIFKNMSSVTFCLMLMFITVVLTNLCNSLVIGMLLQPVIATFCVTSGMNPAPLVALLIIFVLSSAGITPAASPYAAMLHGNKEWLQSKDVYKYASIFVILELILICAVGIPAAMALIH
ncbi:MAG: citrate transporter [Lachnospiraceae bacterium]|jgi:sodium-dependent dicarboxylate transporter 2/3/5